MMGKQSAQIQMVILDIDAMIPEDHLLRKIKNCVNFDFIYEKAAPYYSHVGRSSIDPVILIKMRLIGYLYGIKSERRLEEVSLNLAYCWFCGIDLTTRVPDHSIFSQNRRRRFRDAGIFREIFNEIVLECIQLGIVSGETGVADGSFLPSNVSWDSRYEAVETVNRSTVKYMKELEAELACMPGYRKPENEKTEKKALKSQTDPECGYIHQVRKKGLGYLTEITVDTAIREYQNHAMKKGFHYEEEKDRFVCIQEACLEFNKLIYKKATQNYYRLYSRSKKQCKNCPQFATCATDLGTVRINASAYYVEWGTAATILPFERISKKLQEYLKEYRSPYGGVSVGIYPELIQENSFAYKGNLLNDINKEMRMELFSCLGLKADATFDEFAAMFGGLTKKQLEEGAKEEIDLKPALNDYYSQHMADGTFVSWLAVDGEKIIGTSGMSFVEKPPYFGCPSGRIGLLSSMFVSENYRRQGIAKELLSRVVNEAKEYGCGTVQITASDMGVLLYTDFGFVKNGNFMQYKL